MRRRVIDSDFTLVGDGNIDGPVSPIGNGCDDSGVSTFGGCEAGIDSTEGGDSEA